jgi:hypothetical protein
MKKIVFSRHVLPHLIAVAVFLVVTIFFFKPVFFEHKKLLQNDIQEWEGSSKELRDFRKETGEEGLWASSMFSGMPAYLINVQWGNQPISYLKTVLAVGLPHPVANIFIAFVCYYIMLLAFGVRPYLSIGGAIAFGLSTYLIVGLSAGHNARVGAIAFMPLVMAGIHLAFTDRRILGLGLTATAFALHLRENHLQITYYFGFIVLGYGLVQLVRYYRANQILEWAKNVGILIPAVLIGIGSFIGPLWAITEYSAYSIRGKSELVSNNANHEEQKDGLGKVYAFEFSNGILEPMTLLIPNFYGGASSNLIVQDDESDVYKALSNSRDNEMANQLARYTSAYWGPQRLAVPYYAGAIIVFLFALGIAFGDKQWVWWLVPIAAFGIILSWGNNFQTFNYFFFDYFPGYNKFRSVTFALIITLFALPLLGFLGLERLLREGLSKENKKKLLIVLGVTGGICVLSMILSGILSFTRAEEAQLPPWFLNALADDRHSLLMGDAFRSLAFIAAAFVAIYAPLYKKAPMGFYAFIILVITIDLSVVNKRYMREENFTRRTRDNIAFTSSEADQIIQKDKSHYRVYTINPQYIADTWNEARTSYFHNSIGGYHGAKLKRYQDLLDSCLYNETTEFLTDAQARDIKLKNYGILNMLNTKYFMYGEQANAILTNTEANGNAWFVNSVVTVHSPTEELQKVCDIDTRSTAVIDDSKFKVTVQPKVDSASTVKLLEYKPNYLKYESSSSSDGIAVFSEIYYDKGWKAFIDQREYPVMRANYILRALEVPAGKHLIEFKFEPAAYFTGNKITTISSWLVLLVLAASIGYSVKKEKEN